MTKYTWWYQKFSFIQWEALSFLNISIFSVQKFNIFQDLVRTKIKDAHEIVEPKHLFGPKIFLDPTNLFGPNYFLGPMFLWTRIVLVLFYIFGLILMIQPKHNNNKNAIFMGFEINLVILAYLSVSEPLLLEQLTI